MTPTIPRQCLACEVGWTEHPWQPERCFVCGGIGVSGSPLHRFADHQIAHRPPSTRTDYRNAG